MEYTEIFATPSATSRPMTISAFAFFTPPIFLYGMKYWSERLFLEGLEPREVGLVVGEDSRHEFDVRAIGVGQVSVPGLAEFPRSPKSTVFFPGDT